MMAQSQPDWRVLLIGGSSGVGKTLVARELARHFGVSLILADDVRLALQEVTTPAQKPELHGVPVILSRPYETLAERIRAVCGA
jgi:2-phosphoglycerate kinase